MKRAALFLLMAATTAQATSERVSVAPPLAWNAVYQAVILQGLKIEQHDSVAGILRASGSFMDHPSWFSCENRGGILKSADFTISIVVRPDEYGGVLIDTLASGMQKKLRYHHVLFIKTVHHWEQAECWSAGVLEETILKYVRERAI